MKPESLHALSIDRELGELSPETLELLEAWLTEHPEANPVVSSIGRTLATTSATVRRFPELARPELNVIAFAAVRSRLVPLALAASIFLLLGGTTWLGFRAGRESIPRAALENRSLSPKIPSVDPNMPNGPWARYALASDPRGGLTVVRRD